MIVLDTNIVSAVIGKRPIAGVCTWLDALSPSDIWMTSVNLMELRFGIERMRDSVGRGRLQEKLDWFVAEILAGRILSFDLAAAVSTAQLAARLEAVGRPVGPYDTQIAGICLANAATLATRNVKHFVDTGIPLINPFDA